MSLENPKEGLDAPDVYYVKVWRKDPKSESIWHAEIDQKTTANSAIGAMQSVTNSLTAQVMLENQKAIDAPE